MAKKKRDLNELAKSIVDKATDETPETEEEIDPIKALTSKAGKAGGKARAEKLTPEERSEIAKKAAKARWEKKKKEILVNH